MPIDLPPACPPGHILEGYPRRSRPSATLKSNLKLTSARGRSLRVPPSALLDIALVRVGRVSGRAPKMKRPRGPRGRRIRPSWPGGCAVHSISVSFVTPPECWHRK